MEQKCARKKRKKVTQNRARFYSIFEITLLNFQNMNMIFEKWNEIVHEKNATLV